MTTTPILAPADPELEEPDWVPPAPPTDLIFDDGVPLESNRHRIAMNALIDAYHEFRADARDYFAGGNMFVYYSTNQVRNQDFRGPDFFVVLNVDGQKSRQGWVVWEEGGRYPDVIVELLSPSTESVDRKEKKDLYEQVFKTRNYFIYDPFQPSKLTGWELDADFKYRMLVPNERGWLWSAVLGLWLGSWTGEILNDTAAWLRFYDEQGNLIPLAQEQAEAERQRAETERQRAETERQRAETERQRAETEGQRAEAERQRAETAAELAEAEGQRAETERQRAEAERKRAETAAELAEAEHQRAETERQRAEAERKRAETATELAETERQRAEVAEQRAALLMARLRELGFDNINQTDTL